MNDPASARSATGAPKTWTRKPATLGPAMYESERVVIIRPCASTYWARWTSATTNETLARSKQQLSAPTANVTTNSCQMVRPPSQ